jgi:hypothetical protein
MGRAAQASSVDWSTETSARRIGEAVLAATNGGPRRPPATTDAIKNRITVLSDS